MARSCTTSSVTLHFLIIYFFSSLSGELSKNPCGYLYLTQSPYQDKHLELNWDFTCDDRPDTILLTQSDPLSVTNASVKILYQISPGSVVRGYHKTNISFENITFPGGWNENDDNPDLAAKCLNYYISSSKDDVVIYSQCLSIAPVWMSNFGELRIGEMMIPGTHNSGAWRGAPPLIQNYVLNQDKSFWQQLVFGIRYFDIRIGRYGKPPNGLYINHAFVKCTALLPELLSVANFINKSPKEVVILDFHRFPHPTKFSIEYHQEILDVVGTLFKNLLVPYPKTMHVKGPKLKELWQSGQRVIISYSNNLVMSDRDWIWPTVTRYWGNIQRVRLLEDYIKRIAMESPVGNPMAVLMAELTPNYLDLKDLRKNLKQLATMVNKDLAYWVRTGNYSRNLNVIATDFFTGNDIINVALEANFRKINIS